MDTKIISPSRSSQPRQAKIIIKAGKKLFSGRFATGMASSAPPMRISHPTRRWPRSPLIQDSRRSLVKIRQNLRSFLANPSTASQNLPWMRKSLADFGSSGLMRPFTICHPSAIKEAPQITVSGPSGTGCTKGTARRKAAKQKEFEPMQVMASESAIPSPRACSVQWSSARSI